MKIWQQSIAILLALVILLTSSIWPTAAQSNFANCRLGVGGAGSSFNGYDIAQLNVGLFSNWWASSSPPGGLPSGVEYIQTIRVHQDKEGSSWHGGGDYVNPPSYSVRPSLSQIANIAANRRGSVWIIGNEPDRRDFYASGSWRGQDEITPELYAKAFHEIRAAIKSADPTARIGIGSVVQGSVLRMKYLTKVWNSYTSRYGYSMGNDIDVWSIHGFILREEEGKLGADIPAGLVQGSDYSPNQGFLYGSSNSTFRQAHHNINNFKDFTQRLRSWMADHGERNKPLIVTEYGVLYKKLGGGEITDAEVGDYLQDSFDYMLSKTDNQLGYVYDDNRLVQGWVWYSLNDTTWNGQLFNPNTKNLTQIGNAWKSYVSNSNKPLASQPQPDLFVTNLSSTPSQPEAPPGGTVPVTLKVDVANSGNIKTNTGNDLVVHFWNGPPNGPNSVEIGSKSIKDLPGCGHFTSVEFEWLVEAGEYTWYAQVESVSNETDIGDNVASRPLSVGGNGAPPQVDLAITKSVNEATPYTNQPVIYTINVTNNGPDTAYNVVVTDLLPAGLTFESYTATEGSYNSGNGQWQISRLNNNEQATLSLTARVQAGQAGQTITNSASVSAVDDPVTNNNIAAVDIVPVANADLKVEPIVASVSVLTGEIAQHIITVRNNGPDPATNVVMNSVWQGAVSVESVSSSRGSCNTSAPITCNLGTLAKNGMATITIDVSSAQPGTLINTASVSGAEADLTAGNNTKTAETMVRAPVPGRLRFSSAAYSINEGTPHVVITAHRVQGSDGPVSVTYQSSDGTAQATADYQAVSGTLTWNDGDSANKTFVIPIVDDDIVEENETLSLSLSNPTGGATLDTPHAATVTIIENDEPEADLTVTQSDTPDPVEEGQSVVYEVIVTNDGPDPATGVSLVNSLAGDMTVVEVVTSQGSCSGTSLITCNLGTLAKDGGATVTITVQPQAAGSIANTATVNGNEADPQSANNIAIAETTVNGLPVPGQLRFSQSSYSIGEGQAGATITVRRVQGGDGAVSVAYATSPGTAEAGSDYQAVSGTLTWADGDTANKTFNVPILNDDVVEGNQLFSLTLSNPTGGAALGNPNTATVVIEDDDSNQEPESEIDLVVVQSDSPDPVEEGQTVEYQITVTNNGPDPATGVTLVNSLAGDVTVEKVTTSKGSCSGTLLITCNLHNLAKDASATIKIEVKPTTAGTIGNTATANANETEIAPANNTAVAETTVNGQPVPGRLKLSQVNYQVLESGTEVSVTVQRVQGSDGAVSVAYATDPGTAEAGSDYQAVSGTLTWTDGDDNDQTFPVPILDDDDVEGVELFSVTLSNPTGGSTVGNPRTATVLIQDNDAEPEKTVDLALDWLDLPTSTFFGQEIEYTITVYNGGPDEATEVWLTNVLSGPATIGEVTTSQGVCSQAAPISCTLDTLSVNSVATITVLMMPTETGLLTQAVTVGSQEVDAVIENNSSTRTVMVDSNENVVKNYLPLIFK